MILPRIFDLALWRCFFRLLAAIASGNVIALTNVERDIQAVHDRRIR